MMYRMKKIISHDEMIVLPKCMYQVTNPNENLRTNDIDINVNDQVIKLLKVPNNKMTELEQRQDILLKKLDVLYERIKTISSICSFTNKQTNVKAIPTPEEVVLNINPDSLPWYLNIFLTDSSIVINVNWHIHSSVPNEKISKIMAFVKNLKKGNDASQINVRLIFKSADPELKLSSLTLPILGNVNILRYLSLVYPTILPYDHKDYKMDGFLDLCHLLEKSADKNKEAIMAKLFSQSKDWIWEGKFSIVDIAAYNVIKQLKSRPKAVPENWFRKCEKLCL